MSYTGHEYNLNKSQLKRAFETAKSNEHAFLIHYGTSSNDYCSLIIEDTAEANQNNLFEEIADLYNRENTNHQRFFLVDIYNTAQTFNEAAQCDENRLAANLISEIKHQDSLLAYQEALANRPFWKKLLNLEP